MSRTPVLRPDGPGPLSDGPQAYRIPGYPHLRVEACFDDPEIQIDGVFPVAHLVGWTVRDTRMQPSNLKATVFFGYRLADVRDWVRAGGPGRATS